MDDIDDEEECMAEDEEDEENILDLNQDMLIGEELLVQEFALSGPEAEKVTPSIYTSKNSSLTPSCSKNSSKEPNTTNTIYSNKNSKNKMHPSKCIIAPSSLVTASSSPTSQVCINP